MARGYPDFFGYSTFPFHGPTLFVDVPGTVIAAGTTGYIVDVIGKGLTRGGYFLVTPAVWSNTCCTVVVELDGQTYNRFAMIGDVWFGLTPWHSEIVTMTCCNAVGGYLAYRIMPNWTWGNRIRLGLAAAAAGLLVVDTKFAYCLIQ